MRALPWCDRGFRVRITDSCNIILAVRRGRKARKQTNERTNDQTFNLQTNSWINESFLKVKYLETIPDILSMYGVFTSQCTSQVRQEMSISRDFITNMTPQCRAFSGVLKLNFS